MREAAMILLIILGLAYCKHQKDPTVVFENVKSVCDQECGKAGSVWGKGLFLDEGSLLTCFCQKGG